MFGFFEDFVWIFRDRNDLGNNLEGFKIVLEIKVKEGYLILVSLGWVFCFIRWVDVLVFLVVWEVKLLFYIIVKFF